MARPISAAQRAAYQRNAQKSTGPLTPSGKANSRLNAVKNGLTAKLSVLSFESAADFEALRDGFLQDFAPQTTYQRYLVTQLATHAWRTLALTLAPHPGDPHNHLLRNYFRYSRDIQANFHRTRQALAQASKIEPTPVEKAVESTTPGFVSSPLKPEGAKRKAQSSHPPPLRPPKNSARLNYKCLKIKHLQESDGAPARESIVCY